jgi:hypothetical protein
MSQAKLENALCSPGTTTTSVAAGASPSVGLLQQARYRCIPSFCIWTTHAAALLPPLQCRCICSYNCLHTMLRPSPRFSCSCCMVLQMPRSVQTACSVLDATAAAKLPVQAGGIPGRVGPERPPVWPDRPLQAPAQLKPVTIAVRCGGGNILLGDGMDARMHGRGVRGPGEVHTPPMDRHAACVDQERGAVRAPLSSPRRMPLTGSSLLPVKLQALHLTPWTRPDAPLFDGQVGPSWLGINLLVYSLLGASGWVS